MMTCSGGGGGTASVGVFATSCWTQASEPGAEGANACDADAGDDTNVNPGGACGGAGALNINQLTPTTATTTPLRMALIISVSTRDEAT